MFLRFEPVKRRIRVALVARHYVSGRSVQERVGNLGSYIVSEMGSADERRRFWGQLASRFEQIEAKFPGRLSSADLARFTEAVAKRIARPAKAERARCFQVIEQKAPRSAARATKGVRIEA